MMSRPGKFFALWFSLLIVSWTLIACSSSRFDAIPAGAKVLVIGDSITAGYGFDPDQAWTSRLASETNWQIINAGVSGDTTSGGLARLPTLLDEHRPLAVIIELGGNDMLRRQSPAVITSNLEAMIELIQNRKILPILMATPRPSVAGIVMASLSDAPFYAEIASKRHIPLIEDAIASTLSKAELRIDELHPTIEGHQQIGTKVVKSLRKQGLVR